MMKKIGRYDTSHAIEDQYEPGSNERVLKNLLGIKDKLQIDRIEAIALKQAEEALIRMGAYGKHHRFSSKDICKIHEIWLGNIYPWAGHYRQVKISKGAFAFAFPAHIPKLMEILDHEVLSKQTPCLFSSQNRTISALSEVHVELILIHPFREGNGRVARILSTLMALQAGLPPLSFTPIGGRGTGRYIEAIHQGIQKNYRPMRKVFEKIVAESLLKARKK